jgi:pimeloyl-ACP methyl ester carboxylesterase
VFEGDREFLVRQTGPEDAPDVVLVHGLGGSSLAEWYQVAPLLAERFRVTLVDHRSHGLSPKVAHRFDIADVADEIAAVLGRVGVSSADFVGYSMGGAIVQELAHRHPHTVRRMVLVATFGRHPEPQRTLRRVFFWLERAFERVTGLGAPEARSAYLLSTGAVAPEHARWLWEETHRRDPEAGAASSFALMRFDSTGWIGRLRQPSVVVVPTSDQLVPPPWQYKLGASLRDTRVVELAGAGHEVPWTHAEELAEVCAEFFAAEG